MTDKVSPGEKMSLRKKIKPPKPFAGEVMDDLSSSIHGDRIIDSSKTERPWKRSQPFPASRRPLQPESSSERSPPQKSSRKRPAQSAQPRQSKVPRFEREQSETISRGRTLTRASVWRPGAGLTPLNNRKYLGPPTEFNPNLPPARFPTYTSAQYHADEENGRNLTPEPSSMPEASPNPSENDAVTEYSEDSEDSETEKEVERKNHASQPARMSPKHPPSHTATTSSIKLPIHTSSDSRHRARINELGHLKPMLSQDFEPTEEEQRRIDRVVSAALHSKSSLKAGTSLTGGFGVHGLTKHELASQGPLAGDMVFEKWHRSMARGGKRREEHTDDEDILDDNIFEDGFVSPLDKRTGLVDRSVGHKWP